MCFFIGKKPTEKRKRERYWMTNAIRSGTFKLFILGLLHCPAKVGNVAFDLFELCMYHTMYVYILKPIGSWNKRIVEGRNGK
jgi:hypothetical protein